MIATTERNDWSQLHHPKTIRRTWHGEPSISNVQIDDSQVKELIEKKLFKPKIHISIDLPMFDEPLSLDVDSTSTLAELRAVLLENWPTLQSERVHFYRKNGERIWSQEEYKAFADLHLDEGVVKLRYDP